MDNMNLPTSQYQKTHIITYNNKDYYLHHLSLINCIKNILSIPNLFLNFALNFKKIEVIILINYLSYKLNLIYYNYLPAVLFILCFVIRVINSAYIRFGYSVFTSDSLTSSKIFSLSEINIL